MTQPSATPNGAAFGAVVVSRPLGRRLFNRPLDVRMDGVHLGQVYTGQQFRWEVPSGSHRFEGVVDGGGSSNLIVATVPADGAVRFELSLARGWKNRLKMFGRGYLELRELEPLGRAGSVALSPGDKAARELHRADARLPLGLRLALLAAWIMPALWLLWIATPWSEAPDPSPYWLSLMFTVVTAAWMFGIDYIRLVLTVRSLQPAAPPKYEPHGAAD